MNSMNPVRNEFFGVAARRAGSISAALLIIFTLWAGTANATLIGDTVTVGHEGPMGGATPPSTFAVADGTSDIYTFYWSYPYAYQVNVEADSIYVTFDYLPGSGTWADEGYSCSFTPPFECGPVPVSFNGLVVSGLNDSSGNVLQNVLVSSNMVGWDSSRLAFGSDYVMFDWKGLSFDPSIYLTATLDFGSASVPEPGSLGLMLAAISMLGFVPRRRKLNA